MKKWVFVSKTLIQQGFESQMTISSPTTSIYFFRGNAKLNRESNEQEKSGCHPCKNGHLTPKLCIKGKLDDDEPSNHLELSEIT